MDDLVGKRVGKIIVTKTVPAPRGHRYECKCRCGNVFEIRGSLLRAAIDTDYDKTCGRCCVYVAGGDSAIAKLLYNVWRNMVQRSPSIH